MAESDKTDSMDNNSELAKSLEDGVDISGMKCAAMTWKRAAGRRRRANSKRRGLFGKIFWQAVASARQ